MCTTRTPTRNRTCRWCATRRPSCSKQPAGSVRFWGASISDQQALAEYGMHLGTAFQLIDDVLDYSGDLNDTGKNLGVTTWPKASPRYRSFMRNAKAMPNSAPRSAMPSNRGARQPRTSCGGTERHRCFGLCAPSRAPRTDRAAAAIEGLTDSVYREALLQLCVFAVERRH